MNFLGWTKLEDAVDGQAFAMIVGEEELAIERSVVVSRDLQWSVEVKGKKVQADTLHSIPATIGSHQDLNNILRFVEECSLCRGNPDEKYTTVITEGNNSMYVQHS